MMSRNIAKPFKMELSIIDISTIQPKYRCFFTEDVELFVTVKDENLQPLDLSSVCVKVFFINNGDDLRQDDGITITDAVNGKMNIMVRKNYIRLGTNTVRIVLFDSDQEVFLQPFQVACIDSEILDDSELIVDDDFNVRDEFLKVRGEIDEVEKDLSSSLENIENEIDYEIKRNLKSFRKWSKDKFGFYSFDFIGDSITEGYDSTDYYKNSYFALVRNSLLNKYNSTNTGFVNMTTKGFYHTITKTGAWTNVQDYNALGNESITTSENGAILEIWNNNQQKFFKICFSSSPGLGSFEVYNESDGVLLATVNCNTTENYNNITQEFCFSENIGSNLIKIVCKTGTVRINGIWYYDNPDKLMVNNYARSGMALNDTSLQLIDDMTTGNFTFFALNHNDSGTDVYKTKLDRVVANIKNNNGFIFLMDFRWFQTVETDIVKQHLFNKYKEIKEDDKIGSFYCDFGKIYNHDYNIFMAENFFYDDTSHPSDKGMKFLAESICDIINIPFFFEKKYNHEWVYIGDSGSPNFKNGNSNYPGYKSKFKLKDDIVTVKLYLDSAREGVENYVFILPLIYRPDVDTRVCIQHMTGNALTMHIGMDGKVYLISDIGQNHRFINFCYPI